MKQEISKEHIAFILCYDVTKEETFKYLEEQLIPEINRVIN